MVVTWGKGSEVRKLEVNRALRRWHSVKKAFTEIAIVLLVKWRTVKSLDMDVESPSPRTVSKKSLWFPIDRNLGVNGQPIHQPAEIDIEKMDKAHMDSRSTRDVIA